MDLLSARGGCGSVGVIVLRVEQRCISRVERARGGLEQRQRREDWSSSGGWTGVCARRTGAAVKTARSRRWSDARAGVKDASSSPPSSSSSPPSPAARARAPPPAERASPPRARHPAATYSLPRRSWQGDWPEEITAR